MINDGYHLFRNHNLLLLGDPFGLVLQIMIQDGMSHAFHQRRRRRLVNVVVVVVVVVGYNHFVYQRYVGILHHAGSGRGGITFRDTHGRGSMVVVVVTLHRNHQGIGVMNATKQCGSRCRCCGSASIHNGHHGNDRCHTGDQEDQSYDEWRQHHPVCEIVGSFWLGLGSVNKRERGNVTRTRIHKCRHCR